MNEWALAAIILAVGGTLQPAPWWKAAGFFALAVASLVISAL